MKDLIVFITVLIAFVISIIVDFYPIISIVLLFLSALVYFVNKSIYYKKTALDQREMFIKTLRHDLKVSTLAQIRGLEILLQDASEKNIELVQDVLESCNYTYDMINSLVTMYNISDDVASLFCEKNRLEEILDINNEKFVKLLKKKNLKIKSYILTKDLVFVDKKLLQQAFGILLEVAINYSNENSNIIFLIRNCNNEFEFSIGFNGNKFDKREFDNLFNNKSRFSTVGLYIKMQLCKRIIECHGGQILANSKENNINYFTFTLPSKNKKKVLNPLYHGCFADR